MKNFWKKVWIGHGMIGKFCTCFVFAVLIAAIIGIPLGFTRCQKANEVYYTNIFLDEEFELHDGNYFAIAKKAYTKGLIDIIDKSGESKQREGNFICVDFYLYQKEESKQKSHKIDSNDFKLKDHTGVHVPTSDIAGLVGWDMVDYNWDQAKNGFVVSSAEFSTRNVIKDYSYIGKEISAGKSIEFTIYFEMDSRYKVESEIMVLEVDFFVSWNTSSKRKGEDIILLPRPENLSKENT